MGEEKCTMKNKSAGMVKARSVSTMKEVRKKNIFLVLPEAGDGLHDCIFFISHFIFHIHRNIRKYGG